MTDEQTFAILSRDRKIRELEQELAALKKGRGLAEDEPVALPPVFDSEAFERAFAASDWSKPGYLSGGEKVWMRKGFELAAQVRSAPSPQEAPKPYERECCGTLKGSRHRNTCPKFREVQP